MTRHLALSQADGHAPVECCPDCLAPHGAEVECDFSCPECSVPLEYNARRSQLKCRGCNYRREAAE